MQISRTQLRISQIEAGARRSNFSAVDLNKIGADVEDLSEPLAEERGIQPEFGAASHPALASGDL